MSNAVAAIGTLLKIGDGATPTETFATIAEVNDISGPGFSRDTIDVTNHSSVGGYKEYIGSLRDGDEVSFDVNWFNDPTHQDVFDTYETQTAAWNFQVVFPTTIPVTLAFAAWVTNFSMNAPVADKLTASVTLKVTGQPTWT